MNWLAKLAEQTKSDDEVLHDTLENLPKSMLEQLSYDLDVAPRPTQMDDMQEKIAEATRMGRELAASQGEQLEKVGLAFLAPLAAGAARMIGGQVAKQGLKSMVGGVAKNVAKDAVINGASKAVSGAVGSLRPPTGGAAPAGGGFNYGKFAGLNLGGLATRAAGYAIRNPGTAATVAGAGVGAMMAPRDPQTGQKQYLRGAVMGGGLAAGANALSGGAIGNKMRSAVMNRETPALGQKTRSFFMDAAKATKGSYGKPAAVPAAGAGAGATAGEYRGGPTMGQVKLAALQDVLREKLANRSTLVYDPANKTFARHNITADASMGAGAGDVIPAGHVEPAGRALREPARGPAPAGLGPSSGSAQTHILHGGDVLSSSPRPGIAARAAGTPPPVPAAAMRAKAPAGGVIGMGAAAAKPKLPNLAGAVSLVGKR